METASGQQRAWDMFDKLGEGDAGEVYRVKSIMDRRPAILKRPRRNAFPSDIIRQATQIEREGRVLRILERLDSSGQALKSAGPARSQPCQGPNSPSVSLLSLHPPPVSAWHPWPRSPVMASVNFHRICHLNLRNNRSLRRTLVEQIAASGKIPELVLVRALLGLIEFLETVHTYETETPDGKAYGILWNDVKPEHLFWDPPRLPSQ